MTGPAGALSCEGLCARYGARVAFSGVTAEFPPGTVTLVSGPNGAGKSTLLSILARASSPAAGRVLLGGRPAESVARREYARAVSFLPQSPDSSALGGIAVRDVVAAGRIPHSGFFAGVSEADEEAASAALRAVGLGGFGERDAASLSGGETRRMFLASTLAQDAGTILLDEPFEGLDAASRASLASLVRRFAAEGRAVVVATHDESPLAGIALRRIGLGAAPGPCAAPPPESADARAGGAAEAPAAAGPRSAGGPARLAVLAALAAAAGAALLADAFSGPRDLVLAWRLPRLATAFCCGGTLAVCGALCQTLFRNPLASPYTLGVASGATFGACLATLLARGAAPVGAAAFAGACLSFAAVRACGGSGRSPRLLLGGVACAWLFSSGTMVCQFALAPWESFSMAHWSLGSVAAAQGAWRVVLPLALAAAASTAALSRPLDAMLSGDDSAASRGIDAARLRTGLLAFSSLLVACVVAVCGPVGFVGLLVPHLGRLVAGGAHRRLLPFCTVFGGLFLALCDAAARALPVPGTLPVGVATSLLGAPLLVFLLARRR